MMDTHQERIVPLLLSHRAMLLGYIASIVRDSDLAEDVFQNVSLVVLNKAHQLRNDDAFPQWARRIARLEALSARRSHLRSPELLDQSMLELVEDEWSASDADPTEWRVALRECVEKLSPKARKLIELRYLEGLSAGDVAERVNSSLNTVYVALTRTYRHLARCVESRLAPGGDAA